MKSLTVGSVEICSHTSRWRCVIVIMLGFLLSGCEVELFSELDEQNANDILLALNEEGISASKSQAEPGKWQIAVKKDIVQEALATLRRHGLPRAQFVSLGEVFAKEGLIATPSEERQRYAFAVSQELSNTLMQIDGVVVARVHPVIPVADPLSDRIPTPSAAVFIKHLHDADLGPMVPAIKRLVAQSIEDLDPTNVALTFSATSPVQVDPPRSAQQTKDPSGFETSGLMITGGLALAALVCWPMSKLSSRKLGDNNRGLQSHHLRQGEYTDIESTNERPASGFRRAFGVVKQWIAEPQPQKKSRRREEEHDGWHG